MKANELNYRKQACENLETCFVDLCENFGYYQYFNTDLISIYSWMDANFVQFYMDVPLFDATSIGLQKLNLLIDCLKDDYVFYDVLISNEQFTFILAKRRHL